jgi:hypothetical protein
MNSSGYLIKTKHVIWSTLAILALFIASILITYFATPAKLKCEIKDQNKNEISDQETCKNIICNNPFKINGNFIMFVSAKAGSSGH